MSTLMGNEENPTLLSIVSEDYPATMKLSVLNQDSVHMLESIELPLFSLTLVLKIQTLKEFQLTGN